jgi:hypothetical protein
MDPLSILPASFAAGETLKVKRAYSDFPAADGWVLTLYLAGASVRTYTADVVGSDHVFTLPTGAAPGTSDLIPGSYTWEERAALGGEIYAAARETIQVRPNIATAAAGDLLSVAEKELAILDAATSGRLTDDMQSYQIAGRAVNLIPIKELEELRDKRRREVHARRNPSRFGTPVYANFGVRP